MTKSIWHQNIDLKAGFSDIQLELFCEEQYAKLDSQLGYRRIPWFYWTSEVYGIGRGIRKYCDYPWWLPLPVYSDHSICTLGNPEPHEMLNTANIHLTWFEKRQSSLSSKVKKSVIIIPFPWLSLMQVADNNKKRKGTIIFFPHSNDGIELKDFSVDNYFEKLRVLPRKFHPLTICLHTHDVRKGLHKKLRAFGLPIVTVGTNSSVFFPDRFFDLVSSYEYGTSPVGGSELFLGSVSGLKFFLHGGKPRYFSVGHSQHPDGEITIEQDMLAVETEHKKAQLYGDLEFNNLLEQKKFVNEILGISKKSMLPKDLKKILFKEMIRQFLLYGMMILSLTFKKLKGKLR